jgi:cell division protein FtsI (penicillin-binding protein 3)
MRKMLLNVVENGTAMQADLSSFLLAGKTGTPRRTVNGRYAAQQYNPNFVGLFPGDAPQYVIVVKLTNARGEKGSIYSASTAAPLTRTILQAALAARDAALDRHKLAASAGAAQALRPDTSALGDTALRAEVVLAGDSAAHGALRDTQRLARDNSRLDSLRRHTREAVSAGSVPYVVSLAQRRPSARAPEPPRAIPDVHGLSLRDAVHTLHSAGFHVRLARGPDGGTDPSPGTVSAAGTVVRLFHDF